MKPDFVAEFVALAGEIAQLDKAASQRLDREIRSRYGGLRVKVQTDPVVTAESIIAEMHKGRVVSQVSANLGISRATIYRRLAEHKRKRKSGED